MRVEDLGRVPERARMRHNGRVYAAIESGRLQACRAMMMCALLAAGRAAWAQDEHDIPIDPKAFAPQEKLIAAICVVVLVAAVWYHLRKQALLREIETKSRRGGTRNRE